MVSRYVLHQYMLSFVDFDLIRQCYVVMHPTRLMQTQHLA